MRSKMGVIKSKMGTIGSKMGRKFEQKRKAKWVKKKKIWSRPTNEAWLIRDKHTYVRHVMQMQYFHVQPLPLISGRLLNTINTALVQ